jgi:hypothetical protein
VMAVTGVQVRSSLQSILSLLLVPCTYALTVTLLKRRLPWACALGATLVVVGASMAGLSSLVEPSDEEFGPHPSPFTEVLCVVLYAAMNLPYAYQYIVTERLFIEGHGGEK